MLTSVSLLGFAPEKKNNVDVTNEVQRHTEHVNMTTVAHKQDKQCRLSRTKHLVLLYNNYSIEIVYELTQ